MHHERRGAMRLAVVVLLAGAGDARAQVAGLEVDRGFGANGVLAVPVASNSTMAESAAATADGGVVMAGATQVSGGAAVGVVRLRADGRPDAGFGSGGAAVVPLPSDSSEPHFETETVVSEVLSTDDGGAVVIAKNLLGVLALRLDSAGAPARRWGAGGVARLPFLGTRDGFPAGVDDVGASLDRKGRLVVVQLHHGGRDWSAVELLRLTPGGALDRSFGTDGRVDTTPDVELGYPLNDVVALGDGDVAVLADGRRRGQRGRGPVVMRFRSDGRLARRFGRGGIASVPLHRDAQARGMVYRDRRLTVGFVSAGFALGAIRLDDRGRVDRRFGRDGRTIAAGSRAEFPIDLVIGRDGRITAVAGSGFASADGGDPAAEIEAPVPATGVTLARLTADGTVDRRFADDGTASIAAKRGVTPATAAVVAPRGAVLVAGFAARSNEGGPAAVSVGADGRVERGYGIGGVAIRPVGFAPSAYLSALLAGPRRSALLAVAGHGSLWQVEMPPVRQVGAVSAAGARMAGLERRLAAGGLLRAARLASATDGGVAGAYVVRERGARASLHVVRVAADGRVQRARGQLGRAGVVRIIDVAADRGGRVTALVRIGGMSPGPGSGCYLNTAPILPAREPARTLLVVVDGDRVHVDKARLGLEPAGLLGSGVAFGWTATGPAVNIRGVRRMLFPTAERAWIDDAVLDGNGRILLLGSILTGDVSERFVMRLLADGELDRALGVIRDGTGDTLAGDLIAALPTGGFALGGIEAATRCAERGGRLDVRVFDARGQKVAQLAPDAQTGIPFAGSEVLTGLIAAPPAGLLVGYTANVRVGTTPAAVRLKLPPAG